MNRRRALTMIETLLALALLASIAAAAASWTTIATRAGSRTLDPLRRQAAVEAFFALVHDDLATGDFVQRESARGAGGETHRVRVIDGGLEIDSRQGTIRVYRFDRTAMRMERVERLQETSEIRVLLSGVMEFECTVDQDARVLQIEINLVQGNHGETAVEQPFMRRLLLP